MADNVQVNEKTTDGAIIATAEMSFSGDTATFQIVGNTILVGSEGSWAQTLVVGGAGAVTGGVQRMTLASDDPAVTSLQLIDDAVAAEGQALGKGVLLQGDDGTDRTNVLVDTDGHLQIDVLSAPTTAVTGTFWQGTQPISGTVTANLGATDNAVLDAIAASVAGTLTVGSHAVTNAGTFAVQVDAALPAGTNAIGKLAANSGIDIGDVDVTSISAGTTTIGGVIGQASSSIVYDGTTACTVKRFSVVATADDATVIAAPSGTKTIRVLSMTVMAISATATTFHLQTKTTNSDCLATAANPIPIAVDADGNDHGGVVLGWNPAGWFETADADEILAVKMPGGAQAMLFVGNYIEVE